LSNNIITNYSAKGYIRIDLVIGIDYESDLLLAKKILFEVMTSNDDVLDIPAPKVSVIELADSSINLAVRPFVRVKDYWKVYFQVLE